MELNTNSIMWIVCGMVALAGFIFTKDPVCIMALAPAAGISFFQLL